jgi:hypothetical protein
MVALFGHWNCMFLHVKIGWASKIQRLGKAAYGIWIS